jgi:hypothetical protein
VAFGLLYRLRRIVMTTMRQIALAGLAVLPVSGGCASSKDKSTVEAAKVRIVNEAAEVRGCRVLGTVADNAFEDLQRKAAKLGGNVAL